MMRGRRDHLLGAFLEPQLALRSVRPFAFAEVYDRSFLLHPTDFDGPALEERAHAFPEVRRCRSRPG